MSIKRLHELLNSDKNAIKINRDLLKTLDIEEAVIFSYLVPKYQKELKNGNLRYFNNRMYLFCPVEEIADNLNLSAFRQRNAINKLVKKGLINIKLGQSRARYIWVNDDASVLEQLMYGTSISDVEMELIQYVAQQVGHFVAQKNIKMDSKYLIDYSTPIPAFLKKDTRDLDFSSFDFSWVSKLKDLNLDEDQKPKIRA